MIRTLQIAAVILAVIAVYFLWLDYKEGVFVSLVLSACSILMSFRFQAKARLEQHKLENPKTDETADQ